MIGRRGFLNALGAFAAGAVLDPERLLWVPGRKTIFLPAKPMVQRLVFHRDAYALVMADLDVRLIQVNRWSGRPALACQVLG